MARVEWDSAETPFAVGDRVVTAERLTLPEGYEAMAELLADQPGEVTEVKVYDINVAGQPPIRLSTCRVRLDTLADHELIFHAGELHAAWTLHR